MDKIVYKIRNDIMAIEDYILCEIKYKDILFAISEARGYVFHYQVVEWNNDRNLPSKMKAAGLLGSHKLSNTKEYMYLTDLALRYLKYSQDETTDYSKTPRNKLVVSSLQKVVKNKTLYESAILFENAKVIRKNAELNMFDRKTFDDEITKFWTKRKANAEEAIARTIGLRRNSKVYIYFNYEEITWQELEYINPSADILKTRTVDKSKIEFNGFINIIDTGSEVSASHYIKLYLDLLLLHGKNSICNNTTFTIYSYSAKRAEVIGQNIWNLCNDRYWLRRLCNNNLDEEGNEKYNYTTLKMMFTKSERNNIEVIINTVGHDLIKTITNDLIQPSLLAKRKLHKMTLNKFSRLNRMKW